MLAMVLTFIKILLMFYFAMALVWFILFMSDKYNVKFTYKATGKVVYLTGFKKAVVCLFLSLIWVFVIKPNNE